MGTGPPQYTMNGRIMQGATQADEQMIAQPIANYGTQTFRHARAKRALSAHWIADQAEISVRSAIQQSKQYDMTVEGLFRL